MIKWFKQEKGVTLIELLASLAILGIVIILIGSVHIFGQRQFFSQAETNNQANDLRYSLAMISKEARSAETYRVESDSKLIIDGNKFELINTNLQKNESVLSSRVGTFKITELETNKRIQITIRSTPNEMNQTEEYKTTIYFRDASSGGETDD